MSRDALMTVGGATGLGQPRQRGSWGLLYCLLLASALECVSFAPAARADLPKQAAEKKPKGSVSAAQKTKAPATPKEQAKHDAGAGAPPPPPRPAAVAAGHEIVEHESRIEFDERLVRGQSAAGAIFLFQRAPSEFKSIVEVPDSFRARTVELVQPRRGTP